MLSVKMWHFCKACPGWVWCDDFGDRCRCDGGPIGGMPLSVFEDYMYCQTPDDTPARRAAEREVLERAEVGRYIRDGLGHWSYHVCEVDRWFYYTLIGERCPCDGGPIGGMPERFWWDMVAALVVPKVRDKRRRMYQLERRVESARRARGVAPWVPVWPDLDLT